MGRKPRPRSSGGSRAPRDPAPAPKDRIVDALMRLLATRRLGEIKLADVAEAADVSLAELHATCPGKVAILAAFSRRIDGVVLDGGPGEGDAPRERVFDILMRRFDALAPHRDALRNVARAARCDPCLAGMLNCSAARSMKWMMVAAGADRSGPLGVVAVKGLVLVYGDAFRVWLEDDDPGMAKTMAALDRGLERGSRAMDVADRICARLCSFAAGETRSDAAAA